MRVASARSLPQGQGSPLCSPTWSSDSLGGLTTRLSTLLSQLRPEGLAGPSPSVQGADSGEPCGGQASLGRLPLVTHGAAEGRALAQSRRRPRAWTPHEESLCGHTGHAGQCSTPHKGTSACHLVTPLPWHYVLLERRPPTWPVKGRLCAPPRHGRAHGRPSWPSVLTQSKVLGTQTRVQCSCGGEVGQRPAPRETRPTRPQSQVHGCSLCPSPQLGQDRAAQGQLDDSNPRGDVPPTRSLLSQTQQPPEITQNTKDENLGLGMTVAAQWPVTLTSYDSDNHCRRRLA